MNKTELIKKVAEETGAKQTEVQTIVNSFLDVVVDEMSAGNKVTITGFGTFEAKKCKERMGRNPRNPEEQIPIPAQNRPSFKPSKVLKDNVNK